MSHPPPSQLLQRHRAGDSAAFGQLVRAYQGPLLRLARGLLGRGSEAEDVVQEAFLRLARHPPELVFESPASESAALSSWLAKVVRNRSLDTLRRNQRRRDREQAVAAQVKGAGEPARPQETREAVDAGLARLPVDQREVLVLRLLGDKSYREIAEITGKKIGTVGWLISEGLSALSTQLEPVFGRPTQGGPRVGGPSR